MRSLLRLSLMTLLGLGVLIPATAASAADSVTRSGACGATSTWSLRAAEAEGDVAALRLVVNSTRAGQAWNVTMARQGTQFFSTQRTTNAAGDITVTRNAREVNDVDDVYTARARNIRTGEVCSARVVLPD